jgi:hypothetical protein
VTSLAACCTLAASQTGSGTLPDGSLVQGVEGRLSKDGDRWRLELETRVRHGTKILDKGTALELLPSGALENLVADAGQRPGDRYRLSGQVATYRGWCTLFATSFLPLAAETPDANGPSLLPNPGQDPNRTPGSALPGKGDRLAIPESIQKRLTDYQAHRQRAIGGTTRAPSRLQVLLDQVGVVVRDQQKTFFVTDRLGQNAMAKALEILPCGTLESMERVQSQSPEPVRFRIAGLVTEYEGGTYLLLHRAVREYDYGNLGR